MGVVDLQLMHTSHAVSIKDCHLKSQILEYVALLNDVGPQKLTMECWELSLNLSLPA